jgi:hypothetical protein
MDRNVLMLLAWLRVQSHDSSKPPARRNISFYILAFYQQHRNAYRLFAQVTAMLKNEFNVPRAIAFGSSVASGGLVSRVASHIEDIAMRFGVIPSIGDFQGHPVELLTIFPPALDQVLSVRDRLELQKKMLVYERLADIQLAAYTQQYGYHFVFRAGLREYYMTYV